MAQLIQMRQRIKAIETIKKITQAMRLIAMSTHSRLKTKDESLKEYNTEITKLLQTIKDVVPDWQHPILTPKSEDQNTLIILIGSQKGLCGNFNTTLFHFFQDYLAQHKFLNYDAIAVGKRAIDYMHKQQAANIIGSYQELSSTTTSSIAYQIIQTILAAQKPYSKVYVFSNYVKTFFTQRPQIVSLIPFVAYTSAPHAESANFDEHIWEQKPQEVLDLLAQQCLEANLQYLLFQSLLAEHAARFISMDNSTRNAQNLLEATQLDYNKLRQAKITKELAELVGSF